MNNYDSISPPFYYASTDFESLKGILKSIFQINFRPIFRLTTIMIFQTRQEKGITLFGSVVMYYYIYRPINTNVFVTQQLV